MVKSIFFIVLFIGYYYSIVLIDSDFLFTRIKSDGNNMKSMIKAAEIMITVSRAI